MGKTINLRLNDNEEVIWDNLPKGKRSKILKAKGLKATKPPKIKSYSNIK